MLICVMPSECCQPQHHADPKAAQCHIYNIFHLKHLTEEPSALQAYPARVLLQMVPQVVVAGPREREMMIHEPYFCQEMTTGTRHISGVVLSAWSCSFALDSAASLIEDCAADSRLIASFSV